MAISESLILTILGISCAIGLTLGISFLLYLKHKHRSIWEELGSPSLIYNNSFKNNIAVMKYLWKKIYKKTNDITLHRLGGAIQYFFIFYVTLFFGIIIIGIFFGKNMK